MKIFLIGYMGSGKTTLGTRLSEAIGMRFIDLDDYIEKVEGRTVPEIFIQEGEAGFRGIERRCLTEVINNEDEVVIATGGGTPCFYENMALMNSHGLTIYLKMDAASLFYRLENSRDSRPLLAKLSTEELDAYIRQHLEERKHFYEESKLTVDAFGLGEKKLEDLIYRIANYSR